MTAGGLMAILLMVFLNLTGARPKRLSTPVSTWPPGPKIEEFLTAPRPPGAVGIGSSTTRLVSAGEEALLTLLEVGRRRTRPRPGNSAITARDGDGAPRELEFVAVAGDVNIEDRMTMLGDRPEVPDESEISLRLLRSTTPVRCATRSTTDVDIVTVEVEGRA